MSNILGENDIVGRTLGRQETTDESDWLLEQEVNGSDQDLVCRASLSSA